MKYRAFAFGAAVAAAATGLLPATAMAASAHVATTPPPGTGVGSTSDSGAGSTSGAQANNKNNLSVVVNLPKDVGWRDINNKNVLVNTTNNHVLQAGDGYTYDTGGLVYGDGGFAMFPVGPGLGHTVVVGNGACTPKTPGGLNGLLSTALKFCGIVYDWAYNAIDSAAGGQGQRNTYC